MTLYSMRLVYPDGDWQETEIPLSLNIITDLNGHPLNTPLPTSMMLAYRVFRISTISEIGEEIRCFHLEQLSKNEIENL